jgi:hypothetical protein
MYFFSQSKRNTMKNKLMLSMCLFAVFSILISCNSKNTGSDMRNVTETDEAGETASVKGKYGIKSGIVEYSTQVMGMDAKQFLYFEDYGRMEAQDVQMDIMGTAIHTVTINRDGYIYNIDMVKKTGTKVMATPINSVSIDFENLSEQMIKDMNITKEGTEEFLGKTCEKLGIDYTKMGLKGTYLVYKGVALLVDTEMGAMKMKLVADRFTENASIPAEKFEIPENITFTE